MGACWVSMFAQCGSVGGGGWHLVGPCSFDVGGLVSRFAVYRWKERGVLHNVFGFGSGCVDTVCMGACWVCVFAQCSPVVWHLVRTHFDVCELVPLFALHGWGAREMLQSVVLFWNCGGCLCTWPLGLVGLWIARGCAGGMFAVCGAMLSVCPCGFLAVFLGCVDHWWGAVQCA